LIGRVFRRQGLEADSIGVARYPSFSDRCRGRLRELRDRLPSLDLTVGPRAEIQRADIVRNTYETIALSRARVATISAVARSLHQQSVGGRMRMRMLAAMLLLLPLWACARQGPFERAGEDVDDAVEDVRENVEDAIDDARDDVERRRRR
jgi:hypothetical protein